MRRVGCDMPPTPCATGQALAAHVVDAETTVTMLLLRLCERWDAAPLGDAETFSGADVRELVAWFLTRDLHHDGALQRVAKMLRDLIEVGAARAGRRRVRRR